MTSPTTRIPLNTLAIAFGLAGLANLWSVASTSLGAPPAIAEVLWAIAAIAWAALLVAHTVRGRASAERLVDQLRHPAQGPLAALASIVAMLLGAHYHAMFPVLGTIVVIAAIVASAGFAGWILAWWIRGGHDSDTVHGGYLLPTVASSLIAAAGAAKVGLPGLALGAFAVGMVFWVIMFVVLFARLAVRPPLPDALTPTLAIIVSPPAVAGTAWIAITGRTDDVMQLALTGLTVVLVLMQLALVPRYRRLPFSLGFWSFTFPFAAVAGYGATLLAAGGSFAAVVTAWVLIAAVTALILAIAARSIRAVFVRPAAARSRRNLTAEAGVSAANAADVEAELVSEPARR